MTAPHTPDPAGTCQHTAAEHKELFTALLRKNHGTDSADDIIAEQDASLVLAAESSEQLHAEVARLTAERDHWQRLAFEGESEVAAENKQLRADLREMETQRNAYGEALTRIANGEEPVPLVAAYVANQIADAIEAQRSMIGVFSGDYRVGQAEAYRNAALVARGWLP